ncbi:MAG: hypothetical protein ACKVP0_25800 [Pirellulaceae bacterium]
MRTRLCSIVAAALCLASAAPVSAGWGNELARNLGLGWSDGYHAYEGCPDSRHRAQPWQRRSNRSSNFEEPLAPYLEPAPAVRPAPQPPLALRTSRAPTAVPARSSQLHISRPNY